MKSTTFLAGLLLALPVPKAPAATSEVQTLFEKHIRPVLVEKCQSCHGAKRQRGGLRLDSRASVLKGGDSGPAVLAGQPDASLLLRAVRQQGELKMPPRDKLSAETVEALANW